MSCNRNSRDQSRQPKKKRQPQLHDAPVDNGREHKPQSHRVRALFQFMGNAVAHTLVAIVSVMLVLYLAAFASRVATDLLAQQAAYTLARGRALSVSGFIAAHTSFVYSTLGAMIGILLIVGTRAVYRSLMRGLSRVCHWALRRGVGHGSLRDYPALAWLATTVRRTVQHRKQRDAQTDDDNA